MKTFKIFVVAAVLFSALTGVSFGDINAGLLAYYPLNGNTNDGSGNGYNGTLLGNPVWTAGRFGGGLDFNGDDGVNIPGSAGTGSPFNMYATNLTISAWVNIRVSSFGTIVARAEPYSVTYDLANTANVAYMDYYDESHHYISTPAILGLNTWYHIVSVFDRTGQKGLIYINGIQQAEAPITSNPYSEGATTKIGCRNNETDQAFNGAIDEVRIYNRALSAQEVMELYQVPEPCTLLLLGLGTLALKNRKNKTN